MFLWKNYPLCPLCSSAYPAPSLQTPAPSRDEWGLEGVAFLLHHFPKLMSEPGNIWRLTYMRIPLLCSPESLDFLRVWQRLSCLTHFRFWCSIHADFYNSGSKKYTNFLTCMKVTRLLCDNSSSCTICVVYFSACTLFFNHIFKVCLFEL